MASKLIRFVKLGQRYQAGGAALGADPLPT